MLQNLRHRAADESGFTLIELLVVVLIIGILAAIALPTFLGQRAKAQDATAKADARNAVTQLESCFTDKETYIGCTSSGQGNDAVITLQTDTGYVVTDTSKAGPSGNKNKFIITRSATGYARSCTGTDGCNNSSW